MESLDLGGLWMSTYSECMCLSFLECVLIAGLCTCVKRI